MKSNLVGALVLIAIGLILMGAWFLLQNLGFAGIDFSELLSKWWPLILIAVGIGMLFKRSPGDRDGSR
jgi:hypothetical protein